MNDNDGLIHQGEAIPENLKNMLLVMSNAAVFEVDNNYLMERNRLNNEPNSPPTEGSKAG